ncbi:MAG: MoxR family ATPase [Alicyclobacillus sp.]|nr:MoxR family ATPase [Alicyclobacillus sp.]
MSGQDGVRLAAEWSPRLQAVVAQVGHVMVGQDAVVRQALAACLAGGHVLFEDVPGTGKTTLAATLAAALGLRCTRVQGTPDLLPSELVGTMVFRPDEGAFTFRPGPIFTEILLMDEVNRATPRTQSALLEAMSEGRVSVDGVTHPLPQPFFVMATANPVESQGVFPLPEAQLDRFLVQLRLGYVAEEDELEMVRRVRLNRPVALERCMSAGEVEAAKQAVQSVHVAEDILAYIVRLCRASRAHEGVLLGASPRAVIALTAFCQALALLDGRGFVLPDDVKAAWKPVLRHRLQLQTGWDASVETASEASDRVLDEILAGVPVPTELAAPAPATSTGAHS